MNEVRKYMAKTIKRKPKTREAQTTTAKTVMFTPAQIQAALLYTEDILDRAVVPFLLLGDVAKQMDEGYVGFEASELEIGIKRRDFSQGAREIIEMLIPGIILEGNRYSFEVEGVPVTIRIIERNYTFLQNPDTRHFYLGVFRLPNPFKAYWQVRALLQ